MKAKRIMERWADGDECAMPGRGDVGCPQVQVVDKVCRYLPTYIHTYLQHLIRAVPTSNKRGWIMEPMSKESKSGDSPEPTPSPAPCSLRPPHTLHASGLRSQNSVTPEPLMKAEPHTMVRSV